MRDDVSTVSDRERQARVRLARTETVGPITYRTLLSRYGSAQASLEALPSRVTVAPTRAV